MRTSNGRFQPGESGNPSGRPRGQSITAALRRMLGDPNPKEPSKSNLDRLAEVVLASAIDGDLGFAKLVFERIDGRVSDADSQESSAEDVYRQAAEIIRERQRAKAEAAQAAQADQAERN